MENKSREDKLICTGNGFCFGLDKLGKYSASTKDCTVTIGPNCNGCKLVKCKNTKCNNISPEWILELYEGNCCISCFYDTCE